jgi:plastocyanin
MNTIRTVLAGAALIAALAACSGGGAAASVSPPPGVDLTITAKDSKFDQASVAAPAGAGFQLFFRNLDGLPHNVAIFADASASESLFVGETITNAALLYEVPALQPGEYFFRCDLHPDMKGTVVVAN